VLREERLGSMRFHLRGLALLNSQRQNPCGYAAVVKLRIGAGDEAKVVSESLVPRVYQRAHDLHLPLKVLRPTGHHRLPRAPQLPWTPDWGTIALEGVLER